MAESKKIEGKTKSGFKYSVDERATTDVRMMEAIMDMESGDSNRQMQGISNIVDLVLGADEKAQLKEHIAKKNDGFIPIEVWSAEVNEIISSINTIKNS